MNALPRLLLVEDDTVSRSFLSQALAALPAHVDAVASAGEALACVQTQRHVLWLIDANLPDASGEALLQRLRVHRPETHALALTADGFPERHDALRAAGFAETLVKPIGAETLRARVRYWLRALPDPAMHRPDLSQPWDEAAALAATGGSQETLRALRQLFRIELPTQRTAVRQALAGGDIEGARAELHRLKASCGFVGAAALLAAVQALYADPGDTQTVAAFERAVDDLLSES